MGWILDIASFAVHTVLRVDLEALAAVFVVYHFINTRRAVALCRFCPFGQIDLNGDVGIFQLQVAGLIFFVVGVGQEHGSQFVKTDFAVGLGVADRAELGGRFQAGVICMVVMQVHRQFAAEEVLVDVVERT